MARALRAPRDPAWTADGYVSDRWMPVSPVSGRLDAFQWKVPLAELGDAPRGDRKRRLGARRGAAEDVTPPPMPPASPRDGRAGRAAAPQASRRPVRPRRRPVQRRSRRRCAGVEAVIPLLHVPDDPGPEPAPDLEPEPEPPAAGAACGCSSRRARRFAGLLANQGSGR